jgi:hypothetical protein
MTGRATRAPLLRIAVLAVFGVFCASLGGSAETAYAGPASAGPLRVTAALHPVAVLYGDPVTADVEVEYDPRTVEPSTIRVQPSFIPYVVSSAPVVEHLRTGAVRFRYSLLCVTDGCLPTKDQRLLRLHAVTATARAGTRTVTALASWPALSISSRLAASDLTGRVRFRSPATPPSPEYRFAPGPLAAGLVAVAALFGLVAAALAGRELAGLFPGSRTRPHSRLELAIAYVRDSTRRTDPDRRRALEFLAEAVDASDEPALAAAAAETAWSKAPPTPAGATKLADRADGLRSGAG